MVALESRIRCLFALIVSGSEEDRRFFAEAMQNQTVDVVKRMKEISMLMNIPTEVLEEQNITVEDIQGIVT